MDTSEARKLMNETLEEIALVLGGIFTEYKVSDGVIWQAMKHLDISHSHALAKLEVSTSAAVDLEKHSENSSDLHPALESLLMTIRLKGE